jgi:uroporphyrinogen III methyltransferase / synthase
VNERPLEGIRVAVTRPAHQARPLVTELEAVGGDVVIAPLIVIADPKSFAPLDAALESLAGGRYRWVVFTSVNSVLKVLTRLEALGSTWEIRADVAAVGPATADVLLAHNVPVTVIPRRYTGAEAAATLGPGHGAVLLPRVEGGPRDITEALARLGWDVDEVPAYRNVPAGPESPGVDRVISGDFDVMTLTSASAARNLAALVPPASIALDPEADPGKTVACIGPSTAEAARAAGLRIDVIAARHTLSGLVKAIIEHVRGMAR